MKKRYPIALGLLLMFVALWLLTTNQPFVRLFMERLDHLGYDIQLHTHLLSHPEKPNPIIGIIDIDDKSLQKEGHWPWSRDKISHLIKQLQKKGAAVIAFDILFSEAEPNIAEQAINRLIQKQKMQPGTHTLLTENINLFNEDQNLANAIKTLPSVLALTFLPKAQKQNELPQPALVLTDIQNKYLDIYRAKGFISNIPVLQKAATASGFINIFPDSDGINRHAPLVMSYKNNVYPSLSLAAVQAFLNEPFKLITPSYGEEVEIEAIRLGHITIPTNIQGEALIPFIGKSFTFPYYSATDVMQNKIPDSDIAGKILFIGTSATGLGDLKATSIQSPYPGVEIQATMANGILQQNFSYMPAWTFGANLIITILLGLFAAFAFPYMGPKSLGLIVVLVPSAILMINNWLWASTGLILSLVVPVILVMLIAIVNILYGYLFESRKREHLKTMFGQYVPEKHIDEMLKSQDNFALHGEDREMSVLFADIRGFTTISEGMSAKDLVEMLNTFFTPMTQIIFSNKGTIDKYVGDLIMAFWGAPLKDKNHAAHAIQSALDMQSKVKEMYPLLKEKNWPEIHIGIGINTGHMSVGDMGSQYRRNYTVLGDAVNLASRVEGLTKFYGVDVMVTEATMQNQSKFIFKKLDKVAVKGKKEGITIYEVIGNKKVLDDALKSELEAYHSALDMYFNQQWPEALDAMKTLHLAHPDTKIYSLYIKRIEHFMQNSAPADWDGVYIHTSK